jgi:hypothetical protein
MMCVHKVNVHECMSICVYIIFQKKTDLLFLCTRSGDGLSWVMQKFNVLGYHTNLSEHLKEPSIASLIKIQPLAL